LTLAGSGATGKDVEDQLSAIHDFAAESLLEIPLLGSAEFVIDQGDVHFHGLNKTLQFFQLAGAEQRGMVKRRTLLENLLQNLGARTLGERS
jgi:hypothetical protein